MQRKRKQKKDKTVEEYRAYYTQGYKTDVDMIGIENNIIEFHRGEKVDSCEYHYDGYRILYYESGAKKGYVIFSAVMMPKAKRPNLFNLATTLLHQRKQGTSIYIWAIHRKMNYLKN